MAIKPTSGRPVFRRVSLLDTGGWTPDDWQRDREASAAQKAWRAARNKRYRQLLELERAMKTAPTKATAARQRERAHLEAMARKYLASLPRGRKPSAKDFDNELSKNPAYGYPGAAGTSRALVRRRTTLSTLLKNAKSS